MNKEIQEKIDEFVKVKEEIRRIIEAFPVESRTKILFDRWSLKDVVAHLSNWMIHDVDCLEKLKTGQEPIWEHDFDEFNNKGVEARKDWSWQKVFDEFLTLENELEEMYSSLSENLWDKPIWNGYGLTASKFLNKDVEHQKEHIEEIQEKLNLLSDTVTRI